MKILRTLLRVVLWSLLVGSATGPLIHAQAINASGVSYSNLSDTDLTAGNCVQAGTGGKLTTVSGACAAGGSGTVTSGPAFGLTYYTAAGTSVSGATAFNGLAWASTTAAPVAATSAQVATILSSTPQAVTVTTLTANTSVTAPAVTVSGLTASRCVQTGTGGLLGVAAAACGSGGSGAIVGVNAQTGTSYTVVCTTDSNKLITLSNTGAQAVSVPVASTSGCNAGNSFYFLNLNSGLVTITPTTSTINGTAALTIGPGEAAAITSDGTNYFQFDKKIMGYSAAPTVVVGTGAGTGATVVLAAGSTNFNGEIQLTAGSSPTTVATALTVTFNTLAPFKRANVYCSMHPASFVASNVNWPIGGGAGGNTSFVISSNNNVPASGNLLYYHYICPE